MPEKIRRYTLELPSETRANLPGSGVYYKTRGVEDVLIAVSDGLKGIPESLAAAYPEATLQTCIVHLIRNSLNYASWKDRKCVAAALRPIYTAPSEEAAQAALTAFEQSEWGTKLPHVAASWRRAWDYVSER